MCSRVQMIRGESAPAGVRFVGRGTPYENPWEHRTKADLARVPALNGDEWELETRISGPGSKPFRHADGTTTWHEVRYLTPWESREVFRQAVIGKGGARFPAGTAQLLAPERIRRDLRGFDLACYCTPGQPCHVDVLVSVARGALPGPDVFRR